MKRYLMYVFILVSVLLSACGTASDASTEAPAAMERPSAPAAPDGNFRADNVAFLAATGRPQLVEYFAFW